MVINFGECFKSTWEKPYSELDEEKKLRKVDELLYNFLITPDDIEKYVKLIEKNARRKNYDAIKFFW